MSLDHREILIFLRFDSSTTKSKIFETHLDQLRMACLFAFLKPHPHSRVTLVLYCNSMEIKNVVRQKTENSPQLPCSYHTRGIGLQKTPPGRHGRTSGRLKDRVR